MTNTDKFPDPKVGDLVAYYGRTARHGRPSSQQTIERVTATQIVVAGSRFRRADGWQVGTGYGRDNVAPWTPEIDARIAAQDAEEAVAAQAVALCKRISAATDALQQTQGRYGLTLRKWNAAELERLQAVVAAFEAGVAALKVDLDGAKEVAP